VSPEKNPRHFRARAVISRSIVPFQKYFYVRNITENIGSHKLVYLTNKVASFAHFLLQTKLIDSVEMGEGTNIKVPSCYIYSGPPLFTIIV